MFLRFFVFHPVGKYISLDLFYFVNLTSSCSLIPKNVKLNKFHCFVKVILFQPCVKTALLLLQLYVSYPSHSAK